MAKHFVEEMKAASVILTVAQTAATGYDAGTNAVDPYGNYSDPYMVQSIRSWAPGVPGQGLRPR